MSCSIKPFTQGVLTLKQFELLNLRRTLYIGPLGSLPFVLPFSLSPSLFPPFPPQTWNSASGCTWSKHRAQEILLACAQSWREFKHLWKFCPNTILSITTFLFPDFPLLFHPEFGFFCSLSASSGSRTPTEVCAPRLSAAL